MSKYSESARRVDMFKKKDYEIINEKLKLISQHQV